jgi:hypothetical protein
MKKKLFLAVGCLAMMSCGGSDSKDTRIADAWALFVAGQYPEAHAAFLLAFRSNEAEALVGLGWTTLKMDSIPASNGYFTRAQGDSLIHGYAGWAISSWIAGDYSGSVTRAQYVLDKLPAFVFEYDNGVTQRTMWLVQGYDHYHLGDMANCLNRIQLLDTAFASTTDPAALLAKLDALRLAQ